MALFRYKALNERGRSIRGTVDAESLQDAKFKLIRRQILVTEVFSLGERSDKGTLKLPEILSLTRELARLLEAGLPLYECLSSLEEKYCSHKTHELLLDLCDQIRSGKPFSEALNKHKSSFDLLYRSMIANAEKTGGLVRALQELARLIDRQLEMKKKLIGALLYPALLSTFCLIVLGILLFFVVPSLFDLFEGKELHSFTRFVFACSHFALSAKWFLASLLGFMISGAVWAAFSDQGKLFVKTIFLRFPGVRDLWAKIALASFFRASATLLEGGLPALYAMQQAAKTVRHPGVEKSMELALRQIQEGETFEKALSGKMFIPPLIPRMLGIAQSGGSLPAMMHQIASIYEEDLEKSFTRITTLAQPVLLLILGAMVGFVLLSVLLPLTDVSSFAA